MVWCEGNDNSWSPLPFGANSSAREVNVVVLQVFQVVQRQGQLQAVTVQCCVKVGTTPGVRFHLVQTPVHEWSM